jgi:hypothetical protein
MLTTNHMAVQNRTMLSHPCSMCVCVCVCIYIQGVHDMSLNNYMLHTPSLWGAMADMWGLGCLWDISRMRWTFDIIVRCYMKNYAFIPMDFVNVRDILCKSIQLHALACIEYPLHVTAISFDYTLNSVVTCCFFIKYILESCFLLCFVDLNSQFT